VQEPACRRAAASGALKHGRHCAKLYDAGIHPAGSHPWMAFSRPMTLEREPGFCCAALKAFCTATGTPGGGGPGGGG